MMSPVCVYVCVCKLISLGPNTCKKGEESGIKTKKLNLDLATEESYLKSHSTPY